MPLLKYNNQLINYNDDSKTLLEVLEQNQISVNFQCRDGICGTCRCQLIKGAITYQSQPLAMVKEGELLLCISKSSEDIEIRSLDFY